MDATYLDVKETARLLIRPLTEDDIPIWVEFIMDKNATRFFPDDWKLNPARAEFWIRSQIDRYREGKYGLMALVERSSERMIGQCGLLTQMVRDKEELEIGYHLLPSHWGIGYAIEAATRFKEHAFDENLTDTIISLIDPDNKSSQKVAVRNGMKRDGMSTHKGMPVYVYRINKEDYLLSK